MQFTLGSISLLSGCCYKIKVGFTRGHAKGAFKLHPYMFTLYREDAQ